jgi:hypothetical protein
MSSLTHLGHPWRSTLRSTGALGLAVVLTVGVLLVVASLVGTWSGS